MHISSDLWVQPIRTCCVSYLLAFMHTQGDPAVPVIYQCERTRDGRYNPSHNTCTCTSDAWGYFLLFCSSFSTRRVLAIQHGRPIFDFTASFQTEETGLSHQKEMPKVCKNWKQTCAPKTDVLALVGGRSTNSPRWTWTEHRTCKERKGPLWSYWTIGCKLSRIQGFWTETAWASRPYQSKTTPTSWTNLDEELKPTPDRSSHRHASSIHGLGIIYFVSLFTTNAKDH